MKLVTFYSDSHLQIYKNFLESFEKHLSHKITLLPKKIEQKCQTGNFISPGFDLTMLDKINWIIENIQIDSNETMIFSDCDVQFFGDLDFDLKDNDILFMHDYHKFDFSWFPDGKKGISEFDNYCAGFFICKQNKKILNFFNDIKKTFEKNMNGILYDQIIMNKLISEGYDIKHNKLDSNKYWTVGFSTGGQPWVGQDFSVPPNIIVHHANFTIGVNNKLKLIELVKNKIK